MLSRFRTESRPHFANRRQSRRRYGTPAGEGLALALLLVGPLGAHRESRDDGNPVEHSKAVCEHFRLPAMSSSQIVITGGGTGGHAFPAVAIAEEMQRRGYEITYIGSPQGMEAKLVPERGLKFVTVKSGAVKNQSALKIVKTFVQLFFAVGWAWRYLGETRPQAVIGVGGYVSV